MSPPTPHTTPPSRAGGSRDAPERRRSEGPREGCEPTHVAGTAAADAHPPGEPGWGADPPPPLPVMANKAFGERCEILPPFPLLHRQLLRLRPRHLARRGGSRGACGRVCRQALSWDPSITRDLRGLLLVWSEPWSAEGFSDSVPPPISPPCEIRHRDKKKGIVAGSRNPHLKDDPV